MVGLGLLGGRHHRQNPLRQRRRNSAVRHQRQRPQGTQGGTRCSDEVHQGDDQSCPAPCPAPVRRRGCAGIQRPKPPATWRSASTGRTASPSPASRGQVISQAKVGGKGGSMFTYGLRNEHWDAYLDGPQSKNVASDRQPVFYIYVPDGGSASDFTLISLEKKGNRREFQIGSFGGITGGKSGVKRDKEIAFTAEHAGIRMAFYKLKTRGGNEVGENTPSSWYRPAVHHSRRLHRRSQISERRRCGEEFYDFRIPEWKPAIQRYASFCFVIFVPRHRDWATPHICGA